MKRVKVRLAENPPYKLGTLRDCSGTAWALAGDLFPELEAYEWFERTRAALMALWPWPTVGRERVELGDFIYARKAPGRWNQTAEQITHVMMGWRNGFVVHASSSRGFIESRFVPGSYWHVRFAVAKRPPW